MQDFSKDEPSKYTDAVELCTYEAENSTIKQVEAKILDFSWVFTGKNAAFVIQILSQSQNDAIFATAQIRVFIDFMWKSYFRAILWYMFVPFVANFLSFLLYSSYFAQIYRANMTEGHNAGELASLIVYLLTLLIVILQEISTCRYSKGCSYLTDPWNYLDMSSIILNMTYVFMELFDDEHDKEINVLGSFCIFLMYVKFFYWMRLFKPFSAFIRMISEILRDVQVFFVVLCISLAAFANTMFILNINRNVDTVCLTDDGDVCEPIFEEAFGNQAVDSFVHAYLTGLGDFRTDSYAQADNGTTWAMFLIATIVVQLIFMNLLIAIMGESFSRINEIIE